MLVEKPIVPTFLEKYLTHNEQYESPNSFWKWSAYATIAATLRDHCYRRQGNGALYPNIYVLFLAESGARKGHPVDFSEKLLYKINATKIISGRASIQAILDELSRAETDKATGKILKAGSAIFYAQELAAGIVADPEALNILTDIYDYKSNPYKSRLRTGPCFNLDKIVFSLLAASNEAMLKPFFNVTAIEGGLLARTFLVMPNEFRPPNDFMDVDVDAIQIGVNSIVDSLKEISNLKGEFIFTEGAKAEYRSWYGPFRERFKNIKSSNGVAGRIHTGIVKLAMLLAANEVTLNITKENVEQAIEECLALMPNYNIFTMGSGKSTISGAGGLLLNDLLNAPNNLLTRKAIMREHWQDFDAEILDKLVVSLETSGIIRQLVHGTTIGYQLTEEGKIKLKGNV